MYVYMYVKSQLRVGQTTSALRLIMRSSKIMPLEQNPHQTVTPFCASAFQCMRAGFLCPKSDNFAFFIPGKIKMSFIWKDDFFCQTWHLLYGPLSEAKTHRVVNWLQLLNQLNFVWRHTMVFMQNSYQWCLRNVQLLRTTVNWCCWCFTAAIFSDVNTVFGF